MDYSADEVMNMFGIGELKEKYPHSDSGGQQQRAAIRRTL